MRYHIVMAALLGLLLTTTSRVTGRSVDISGTWALAVDTGSGAKSDGTLVFKQANDKLTGTYDGGMGVHKFTGTVHGNTVEFSFLKDFPGRSEPFKVAFAGTVESPNRLTGHYEHPKGRPNWTATKK